MPGARRAETRPFPWQRDERPAAALADLQPRSVNRPALRCNALGILPMPAAARLAVAGGTPGAQSISRAWVAPKLGWSLRLAAMPTGLHPIAGPLGCFSRFLRGSPGGGWGVVCLKNAASASARSIPSVSVRAEARSSAKRCSVLPVDRKRMMWSRSSSSTSGSAGCHQMDQTAAPMIRAAGFRERRERGSADAKHGAVCSERPAGLAASRSPTQPPRPAT
jgi:hypothetical protein